MRGRRAGALPRPVAAQRPRAPRSCGSTRAGLYDVLLELEADPTFGDLNDRKIVRRRTVDRRRTAGATSSRSRCASRRGASPAATNAGGWPTTTSRSRVTVAGPNRTTTGTTPVDDAELRSHWFDVFYVDYEIELADDTTIAIENASVRLFGDGAVRRQATVAELLGWLGDATPEGFVEPYRRKLVGHRRGDRRRQGRARVAPQPRRGLLPRRAGRDRRDRRLRRRRGRAHAPTSISSRPGSGSRSSATSTRPSSSGRSTSCCARGEPVEAIFNGPELDNGFLTEEGLRDTDLRTELRVSDILDRLIDIDGVISVDNLQLTAYDASGNPITGIADPDWTNGTPGFDPNRISASWLLLPAGRPPAPAAPRAVAVPVLQQRAAVRAAPRRGRGHARAAARAGRPPEAARHRPRPAGAASAATATLEAYHPVQHSFPLTYGIGPAGLPSTATAAAPRPGEAAQGVPHGVRAAAAQRLRPGRARRRPVLARPRRSSTRTSPGEFDADADHRATTRSSTPTLTDARSSPRLVESPDRVPRAPQPVPRPPAGPVRRELRRVRDAAHRPRGPGQGARGPDPRQARLPAGVAPRSATTAARRSTGRSPRATPTTPPASSSGSTCCSACPTGRSCYRASTSRRPPGFNHTLSLDELGEPIVSFIAAAGRRDGLDRLAGGAALDTSPTEWRIDSTDGRARADDRAPTARPRSSAARPRDRRGRGRARPRARRRAAGDPRRADPPRPLRRRPRPGPLEGDDRRRDGNRIGRSDQRFRTQRHADGFIVLMATWAAHKRAIVVEHLLLRPKFPGDALYPACTDGPCCAVRRRGPVLVPAHLRDAGLDGTVQHEPEHARLRRPDDPGADPVASARQDLLGRATTATSPTRATRSSTRWPPSSSRTRPTPRRGVHLRGRDLRRLRDGLRGVVRRAHADHHDPPDVHRRGAGGDVRRRRRPVRRWPCAEVIDADVRDDARRGRARRALRRDRPRRATSSSASRTPGARGPTPTRPIDWTEERLHDTVLEISPPA